MFNRKKIQDLQATVDTMFLTVNKLAERISSLEGSMALQVEINDVTTEILQEQNDTIDMLNIIQELKKVSEEIDVKEVVKNGNTTKVTATKKSSKKK